MALMVQIVALNLKSPFLNSVSLTLTNLHLNEVGLLRQCPWQHPWVTEAGSEQHGHYEDEEQHCKHRDGRRQVHCQVWAPVQDKRTSRVTKDDKENMKLTAHRLNEHIKQNNSKKVKNGISVPLMPQNKLGKCLSNPTATLAQPML